MGLWVKWIAMGPSVAAGTLFWLIALALLPSTTAGLSAVGLTAVLTWVFMGGAEAAAVVLLAGGRRLSRAESRPFDPSRALLAARGIEVTTLYVSRRVRGEVVTEPIGRRSILVSPLLLHGTTSGSTQEAEITVALARAEAQRSVAGGMQHDVCVRLLSLPCLIVGDVLKRLGRCVGWLPGVRLIPPIATVLAATAIWMAASAHVWWLTTLLVVALALCITTPIAQRARARHLRDATDELLVANGLGAPLLSVLSASRETSDIERVHRLEALEHRPRPHLHLVSSPSGIATTSPTCEPNSPKSPVLHMERPK